MRTRSARRAPGAGVVVSVDVAVLTVRDRHVLILTGPGTSEGKRQLPWASVTRGESLEASAKRAVRLASGIVPPWLEQSGAFSGDTDHPGNSFVSVGFAASVPPGDPPGSHVWAAINRAGLGERHKMMAQAALKHVRSQLDHAPVAFQMLPRDFTLTELQHVYEALLGRRLHKASFRRALLASWLVEPSGEWRVAERGRPAQLFTYAPRRQRQHPSTLRFDI
jgi:8-oxo-dGTP diphosphatase